MFRTAFSEGVRWGAVLGSLVVVLSILGLTPSLRWLPEVPLLVAAVLMPTVACALAGFRAGLRSGRVFAGMLTGAVTGGIGGAIGGVCYVLFGKSPLNLVAGLCLGIVGGGLIGTVGALIAKSRRSQAPDGRRGQPL